MAKRAVYPGMFDPIHNGHVDVIQRSLQIFDELIVAVVANPSKQPLFTMKERLEMIDEATSDLSNFRIVAFDGLRRVMRAKGGVSEARYLALLDGHRRLRQSLHGLVRDAPAP